MAEQCDFAALFSALAEETLKSEVNVTPSLENNEPEQDLSFISSLPVGSLLVVTEDSKLQVTTSDESSRDTTIDYLSSSEDDDLPPAKRQATESAVSLSLFDDVDSLLDNSSTSFKDEKPQSSVNTSMKNDKTPVRSKFNDSDYCSPVADGRLNDSLSAVFGPITPGGACEKNDLVSDLKKLLAEECQSVSFPSSLFDSMSGSKDIYNRERALLDKFNKLIPIFPEKIQELQSFYRYQTAIIDTERYHSIQQGCYTVYYKQCLNKYYDNQLSKIIDRIEKSLAPLLQSEPQSGATRHFVKPRPLLSKSAVRLMQQWYDQNIHYPYPTQQVVDVLASTGGVTAEQVKKWFANKRNRSSNTKTLTEIAKRKRHMSFM